MLWLRQVHLNNILNVLQDFIETIICVLLFTLLGKRVNYA